VDGVGDLIILYAAFAVSGPVWLYVARCLRQRRPPLELQPRTTPLWHPLVYVPTLLFVGNSVFALFAPPRAATVEHIEQSHAPSDARPVITLESIKSTCARFALVVLVTVCLMLVRRQDRLANYGMTIENWPSQFFDAIPGFLASLLPVYAIQALMLPWRAPETQHPILIFIQDDHSPLALVWVVLAVVVLAPLAEELQYRVVFQGWLESLMPARYAILIVATIFSAVHGFPDAFGLFPLALILGYVYHRRYRYLTNVALHALFNALNLAIALAGSYFQRDSVTSLVQP
jgi:membrane protease YdiL (CAAX protease family)